MFKSMNEIKREIENEYILILRSRIDDLEKKYTELLQKRPENPPEYASRIADLEVKMAKLWALLIMQTPTGQDKVNKFGKKLFGGKSKEFQAS